METYILLVCGNNWARGRSEFDALTQLSLQGSIEVGQEIEIRHITIPEGGTKPYIDAMGGLFVDERAEFVKADPIKATPRLCRGLDDIHDFAMAIDEHLLTASE